MPQVIGALVAGLVLGPAMLGIVSDSEGVNIFAEVGVIMLMFTAGLETDLKELKKTGLASFVIAVLGVAVPLAGGFLVSGIFGEGVIGLSRNQLLEYIFIGVVLTATSVSITVETLRELGKLKSKAGTTILGAAVIDDILGIIILTIITSMKDPSVPMTGTLFKIVLFFVFSLVMGIAAHWVFKFLGKRYGKKRRVPIYSFAFCLLLAFVAEHYFGIADITGAYIAGIIVSNAYVSNYVMEKIDITSYMIFSPIFFASVGIKTNLSGFSMAVVAFSVCLLIVAILSKVIGCGLGARICGFSNLDSAKIGIGMISRGEVALIVAQKGAEVGLISSVMFPPIIIVVVATTLITPVLLKLIYSNKLKGNHNEDNCQGWEEKYCPIEEPGTEQPG